MISPIWAHDVQSAAIVVFRGRRLTRQDLDAPCPEHAVRLRSVADHVDHVMHLRHQPSGFVELAMHGQQDGEGATDGYTAAECLRRVGQQLATLLNRRWHRRWADKQVGHERPLRADLLPKYSGSPPECERIAGMHLCLPGAASAAKSSRGPI